MKNFKELIAQLAEAQVSTNKYSWGTMKTVHDGSKTSYPLHPEHQAIVKRLRPSGEHAKAMYKDETGAQVHVHREGDKVHFVSHKKSGSHKTTVDYKHFDEEIEEQAPIAPVPDRKYIKGTPENKALRAKNKPINGHPTNVKEEVEQIEEGDLTVRTLYNKFANAHVNGHDTKSTEKVIRKVHGDEVMNHMKKAAKANAKADMDAEDRHFDNAQTAAKKTDRIGGTVGRGRSEFMRKRREWSEEVELSENAPFKKLEHAVAYATDKVKTHRDNLDGIEVYKHKAGGYDVNHTMNASGRNSLNKIGAKHLGTVYKDKPTNIKEEELKEYSMDDLHKDAAARLKKDIDTASDKRIADAKTPKKKEGFFHMVGRKQIAAAKGAIKGFKEQTDLTEHDRESDDYSRRHTVVAHVSDNTGTPADGEKRAVVKKALSVLAATPKHAEKAAHKHFSDKGYKVHKLSAVISKNAPAMQKEDLDEAREFASYDEAENAAKPGQKPKLNPATNKYNLVSEGSIPKGGLDVSKVAHAGDTPHEEDWTNVQKKKNIPFDGPYKSTFKKKNNPNRTGTDAARALAQRGMPKEETEGNPMKSYAEFVQDLQEIKLADLPSRKVTGTSYGAQYHDPEGDDDADNKKPAKAADAPKRGRGRPAGAMSGARQQGSAKQRKTGGVDYTGYKLHLPNNNK
jgi:hypothetical protein